MAAFLRARQGKTDRACGVGDKSGAVAADQAGEVIVFRPVAWSGGGGRRFPLDLDGRYVADLEQGHTIQVWVGAGQHVLRARCWPMGSATLTVTVHPHHTVRVLSYLSALREVEICLDNRADRTGVA
jgi:hypothetical protein